LATGTEALLQGKYAAHKMLAASKQFGRRPSVVKVRSSQKLFTEDEVSVLTGIGLEDLRELARSRHLGFLTRAAEAASEQAERLLFTLSDLMVLTVLYPRYHH
jgi:hypothetical protein